MIGEKRQVKRTGVIITILIIIIVLLAGVLLYALVVKPSFNAYVVKKQVDARNVVLTTILLQIQQQGFTRITDEGGNTIVLVPLTQDQLQVQADQNKQVIQNKQNLNS